MLPSCPCVEQAKHHTSNASKSNGWQLDNSAHWYTPHLLWPLHYQVFPKHHFAEQRYEGQDWFTSCRLPGHWYRSNGLSPWVGEWAAVAIGTIIQGGRHATFAHSLSYLIHQPSYISHHTSYISHHTSAIIHLQRIKESRDSLTLRSPVHFPCMITTARLRTRFTAKVRSLKSVMFITLTLFVVSCPLCSRCISKRFGGW